MRVRNGLVVLIVSVLALSAMASCSSDDGPADSSNGDTTLSAGESGPAAGTASAELALAQERLVIDVRTPEEFAEGHVDGAVNINLQGPDFSEQIGDLDPAERYVVYCRTGNRSAVAAAEMAGIDLDVLDGGGFTTMTDAGWPTA
jgi:rhodanese-related sulfurtransferase